MFYFPVISKAASSIFVGDAHMATFSPFVIKAQTIVEKHEMKQLRSEMMKLPQMLDESENRGEIVSAFGLENARRVFWDAPPRV